MTEQSRPARYYEDQFRFTSSGRRWSELTDVELLHHDPSRAAQLAPPPVADPDVTEDQPPPIP